MNKTKDTPKEPKRKLTNSKTISFRATGAMMARFAKTDDRSQFIRRCVEMVMNGEITLTEEDLLRQMPRYERNDATRSVLFRAPEDVWKFVDQQEHKGRFVRACIEKVMEQEDPLEHGTKNMLRIMFNQQANHMVTMTDAQVQCGMPVGAANDMGEMESLLDILSYNPDTMYLMKAVGNSMIDAHVESGDLLIIDKEKNYAPLPEEIALCELNGEFTLKHFFLHDGCGWLYPENPEYPVMRVDPTDSFHIRGVLHRIIKNPKKHIHFDYSRCVK